MKLEKRESTLNEEDSLKDTFYIEKAIFLRYAEAVLTAKNKETQKELLKLMREAGEDAVFVRELLDDRKN